MRIRLCQRNMKAQQDCIQVKERAAIKATFAAIFKKKNVIWKKCPILKLYPLKISYNGRLLRENLILLQANNYMRRSDCAVVKTLK